MSRGVTFATGRARVLALLAVATLLASLATVTTMAVAPRSALAEAPNCNSIMNPADPQGITVSIVSVGGVSGKPFFYDTTARKWFTAAVDGTELAGGANPVMVFQVDYGRLAAKDTAKAPWCIYYTGQRGNNKDWIVKGTLPASDADQTVYRQSITLDPADYGVGQEICIGARLPARTGGATGAPKDHDCFTVGGHSNTAGPQTFGLRVAVATGAAGINKLFNVSWSCVGSSSGSSNIAGESTADVLGGLSGSVSCTATPVSGPAGENWNRGGAVTKTVSSADNVITVSFSTPADPGCQATNTCEVAGIVTEKPATAPPTDGLASSTNSTVPALGLLLLILAAVLGTLGWLTPATKRIRR